MKKSCKHIDIKNVEIIKPWVSECCHRHYKRYDFRKMFCKFGMSESDYKVCVSTNDKTILSDTIDRICQFCSESISNKSLNLEPVTIRIMNDSTTGKERQIGKESALQQCFDYIAVYSAMDIFKRRMVKEQSSSIPCRGQIYGVQMISKWIKNDNHSEEYAEAHGFQYSRKCKYFVKLDIKKCYPSADKEVFIEMFKRDCDNEDIIWLWQKLLDSHNVDGYTGFMIGALPSQWACQYMLSYIYRRAKSHYKMRHDRRIISVKHMIMFMDDMLLFGSNRNQLKKAVEQIAKYTQDALHWTIKPDWHIRDIDKFNIDMMGYVIRADGSISMRSRNFVHLRRMALRHRNKPFTISQARRILSYKGFTKYSNSASVVQKYRLINCYRDASRTVSNYDRRHRYADN